MTPAEFADVVVVPTVRDFFGARGDRRLAYLSCIATYSLIEYVGRAEGTPNDVRDKVRNLDEPAYRIVQGIANGSKHAGFVGPFAFRPGDEVPVPQVITGGEWGCRYGAPGLAVEHDDRSHFIDICVGNVLARVVLSYSYHFPDFDLALINERDAGVSNAPSDLVFYEVVDLGPEQGFIWARRAIPKSAPP